MGIDVATKISQRDDDRSRPDDYKAVLLDLPAWIFVLPLVASPGNGAVASGGSGRSLLRAHFPLAPELLHRCRYRCVRLDESLCTSRDRSHKRNRRQDRTVDLFRLGNREQEPFPGFFESRTLEHNDAVGSGARRESTRGDPVVL